MEKETLVFYWKVRCNNLKKKILFKERREYNYKIYYNSYKWSNITAIFINYNSNIKNLLYFISVLYNNFKYNVADESFSFATFLINYSYIVCFALLTSLNHYFILIAVLMF